MRSSAWELGSYSCFTALVARASGFPVFECMIKAPKGVGRGPLRVRKVNRWMARMCDWSAEMDDFDFTLVRFGTEVGNGNLAQSQAVAIS